LKICQNCRLDTQDWRNTCESCGEASWQYQKRELELDIALVEEPELQSTLQSKRRGRKPKQ